MRKSITSLLIVLLVFANVPASFAGEYKTGVDAFVYGGYSIPAYDGDASETVNGNMSVFDDSELTKQTSITYGDLDSLNRCTPAFGILNKTLMPTHERGSISSVYPSGWVQEKYDVVPSGWLYNRCHLVGWQLTGADLETMSKAELSKNLITGTRFLNVGNGSTGMVGFENEVASYLRKNADNYVAYRVSPVFQGNNLVATGVLMEGKSIDDASINFCVFCYNVQPQIAIDYETGKSILASAVLENKSISECTITFPQSKSAYTGNAVRKPIIVKDGSALLKEGASYTVIYRNNIYPGKATFTVSGIGEYKGTMDFSYIIVPDKGKIRKAISKKKALKITTGVNAKRGVSGYQIAYKYKNKKWKYKTQKRKVFIITKLKRKASYSVKVRAYTSIDGSKHFGSWSTVRKVKTK